MVICIMLIKMFYIVNRFENIMFNFFELNIVIIIIINIQRQENVICKRPHPLLMIPRCQTTSITRCRWISGNHQKRLWSVTDCVLVAALFISIGQIPFLAPTLDNVETLFTQVITPGLYLLLVEVAYQDPASGSL